MTYYLCLRTIETLSAYSLPYKMAKPHSCQHLKMKSRNARRGAQPGRVTSFGDLIIYPLDYQIN